MHKVKIKILIADDHKLIIDGLVKLLAAEDWVEDIKGVTSGQQVLDLLAIEFFDVVIADINMPGMDGIELTRSIVKLHPLTKVLALTMYNDPLMISRMIGAGALGYVLKNTSISDLTQAILTVAANRKYMAPEVQEIIMRDIYHQQNTIDNATESNVKLTPREVEILGLVCRELSNEQIANKLFISERTVETHRRNIFIKTKCKSIVGLVLYAIEHKLIEKDS